MDYEIRALRLAIEKVLNESGLPAEVKRMMMFEITSNLEKQADLVINQQIEEVKKNAESTQ